MTAIWKQKRRNKEKDLQAHVFMVCLNKKDSRRLIEYDKSDTA